MLMAGRIKGKQETGKTNKLGQLTKQTKEKAEEE